MFYTFDFYFVLKLYYDSAGLNVGGAGDTSSPPSPNCVRLCIFLVCKSTLTLIS